jgi:hypothetical protein
MHDDERLTTHSMHFSINDVSLPAIYTHPMDLVNLTAKLIAGCTVKMPEIADWPRKLALRLNDMQFPMDACFPSNLGVRHESHISIRLPGANDAYVHGDLSTSPAIFLELTITDQNIIRTVTNRVIAQLRQHRTRLMDSGVRVMDLLGPDQGNGLISPCHSQTDGLDHPLDSSIVVSSMSFPATFKFGNSRGFSVCVSSDDPSNQIPFNRALRNQRAHVLHFVSFHDRTTDT